MRDAISSSGQGGRQLVRAGWQSASQGRVAVGSSGQGDRRLVRSGWPSARQIRVAVGSSDQGRQSLVVLTRRVAAALIQSLTQTVERDQLA